MRKFLFKQNFFTLVFILLLFFPLIVISNQTSDSGAKAQQSAGKEQMDIEIPPPPFSEDMFPCTECHADMETNLERRELEEFHDDIILKHDEENRWCMDCHDANNRDMLHSASGGLIDFKNPISFAASAMAPS